jgi:flagellar biosynthesis GTPase FlhF
VSTNPIAEAHTRHREERSNSLITVPGLAQATVTIDASAYKRRAEIIEAAEFCPKAVNDADTQGEVTNVLRDIARLLKETEDGRKLVKAPVLDLGKRIDAAAAEFVQTLEAQKARLNGMLVAYETEQRRIAMEAEVKRQAEIARQQKEAREAQEKIDREAREAEQARLKAERDAREATNAEARAKAQEEARKATEAQQQAAAAKAQQEEAAKLQQAEIFRAPAPAVTRAAGASVQTPWTYEVVDIKALYAACPDLVELSVKRSEVLALIRSGTREIPGLRIYQETRINVRS